MKRKNNLKDVFRVIKGDLAGFLMLWSTQMFSTLGSSMTNFALVIWSYQSKGSALSTALLSVCSYAPYVLMSIFAGALSDRWDKKKTMLVSDTFAAVCTVIVLFLLQSGNLRIWHLYALNTCNGLMNTIQQPASDVATTLLTPKKHYYRISGMRAFSMSLTSILTPVLATMMLSFWGLQSVIMFDLITFAIAFITLLLWIKIPELPQCESSTESVLRSAKAGLQYLRKHREILDLILFLAAINLTASMFDAIIPAFMLPRQNGTQALGILNAVTGLATLAGSIFVSVIPAPKNRVRVICNTLLLSMSTENFILALGKSLPIWCVGAVFGWFVIPMMNANMDVLFRSNIPVEMQGRVYSARNTLQYFTIPIGFFLGGIFTDKIFEPFMALKKGNSFYVTLFGSGKGSGAALLLFVLGIIGTITCVIFRKDPHIWKLDTEK